MSQRTFNRAHWVIGSMLSFIQISPGVLILNGAEDSDSESDSLPPAISSHRRRIHIKRPEKAIEKGTSEKRSAKNQSMIVTLRLSPAKLKSVEELECDMGGEGGWYWIWWMFSGML